jgi:hypothetical protein
VGDRVRTTRTADEWGQSSQADANKPPSLSMRIPRQLVSPNVWNGRHWKVKHRISQEWQRDIWAVRGGANVVANHGGRQRVTVIREVPSGRNFIRDDDNLRFSVKPLLDALKRLGLITGDSRKWIELPTPEQRISADGNYWTEIRIEPVN